MKKILLTLSLAGIVSNANAAASANPQAHVCPDGQKTEVAVLTYWYVNANYVNKFVCSGEVNTEAGVRKLISDVNTEQDTRSAVLLNLIPIANK